MNCATFKAAGRALLLERHFAMLAFVHIAHMGQVADVDVIDFFASEIGQSGEKRQAIRPIAERLSLFILTRAGATPAPAISLDESSEGVVSK